MLRDWGPEEALAPELLLAGLDLIPEERRSKWEEIIREATGADPVSYGEGGSNGWTVKTFQAAWAAITSTPVPPLDPANGSFPCRHLEHALDAAVHAGWDTDTIAAVAGQLLGARWGASAVPAKWMRNVRGRGLDEDGSYQPCMRARDLVRLSLMTVEAGAGSAIASGMWPRGDQAGVASYAPPVALEHPADELARVGGMASLDHGCDAAVSACRVGRAEPLLAGMAEDDRVELFLIDSDSELKNPNLHFVIDDGARAACQLRHEGHKVLIHCVNAETRSPSVAARYAVLRGETPEAARRGVRAALVDWRGQDYAPTPRLWDSVADLGENRVGCDQCPYCDGVSPEPADTSAFHPCV